MTKRRVRCAAHLIEHAVEDFPPGGSAEGRPSFELFRDGPLAAATEFFLRRFDEAPEVIPGIRAWVTIGVPVFPPMVFYAALVGGSIELLDYSVEDGEDYWRQFGDVEP